MLHTELDVAVPMRLRARRYLFSGVSTSFSASAHTGYEIAWVDSGRLRYRVGRRALDVEAGSVMLVPHGVEHACEFNGAPDSAVLRAASLHVDDLMIASLADAAGMAAPVEPLLLNDHGSLCTLGALLLRELASSSMEARLCADALAEAVVVKAVCGARAETAETSHAAHQDRRVRRAIDLIRTQFADDLDVDAIAHAAGTTRFHLSRLFKAATGRSPYQYLLDVRLDDAARSLRRGRSVTDAALSSGFGDLSRFARMFRARFGVAPSAYASSTAARSSSSTSPSTSMS